MTIPYPVPAGAHRPLYSDGYQAVSLASPSVPLISLFYPLPYFYAILSTMSASILSSPSTFPSAAGVNGDT